MLKLIIYTLNCPFNLFQVVALTFYISRVFPVYFYLNSFGVNYLYITHFTHVENKNSSVNQHCLSDRTARNITRYSTLHRHVY